MPQPPARTHAAALAALQGRVAGGTALAGAALIGFRLAIDVYSGPSIALGLAITAGIAVALSLAFICLPETPRTILMYLVSFLL